MNKKIYSFCLIVTMFLNADFNQVFSYMVKVKDSNRWGIGNSQSINNNKGKKGIITGRTSSFAVCPCLNYGVKPWTPNTSIPYSYSTDQMKKVRQNQSQAESAYQVPCSLANSNNGAQIQMAQVFDQAYDFVSNIDTVITTLTNLFPDIQEGQGYESAALLKFCTLPTSLVERINTINTKLFKWAHFENYFEKNEFQLFLDLQQLVPTDEEIKQGNTFANAIVMHYCTVLKSVYLATGKPLVTNNQIIQKEKAIKDALLW